jgi:dTDP-4-dehydrorhamnose reductase
LKVLITGSGGQLGKDLVKTFSAAGHHVFPFTKEELDITKREDIYNKLLLTSPDIIINAAAYTNVDKCEEDVEKAYLINGLGPYYLAAEAKKKMASLFHVSTDYVFSGDKTTPYNEQDAPHPNTIYGKSKRLGEELVLLTYKNSSIIRTSWLYGKKGKNFVNTMLNLSKEKNELKVVNDQIGSPTYAKDLSEAIHKLMNRPFGIYHITNSGSCSWYDFAKEILLESGEKITVNPITTAEYAIKTPRPHYSVLSHHELNKVGITMRHWKEALKEYLIEEMNEQND